MFTGMIQNLLNSSGRAVAMQRAQQLNNLVNPQQVSEVKSKINKSKSKSVDTSC